MQRIARNLTVIVAATLSGAVLLWALLAAWLGPIPRFLSVPVVAAGVALTLWSWLRLRPVLHAVAAALGIALLLVLAWRVSLRPSNERPWQPDVARTAWAHSEGRKVTVHNVRNCLYRSQTDLEVRYEDRQYDLDALRHADMVLVDWGLGAIAHTMFSFGFADGQYLCFSIETRKEIGETYSAARGFFRNYELIYVAADERDVVRLRTSIREGENVYLYRLRPLEPTVIEAVFLEYLARLNQLHDRAEWYNALTDNCMTSAYKNVAKHAVRRSWDWRILLNGYAAELAYELGAVCTDMPFPELKQACLINAKARAVGAEQDFSAAIRQGLPGVGASSPASADAPATTGDEAPRGCLAAMAAPGGIAGTCLFGWARENTPFPVSVCAPLPPRVTFEAWSRNVPSSRWR
jgi:hypothetical protein